MAEHLSLQSLLVSWIRVLERSLVAHQARAGSQVGVLLGVGGGSGLRLGEDLRVVQVRGRLLMVGEGLLVGAWVILKLQAFSALVARHLTRLRSQILGVSGVSSLSGRRLEATVGDRARL